LTLIKYLLQLAPSDCSLRAHQLKL